MGKIFQKALNYIHKHFAEDTSKMLIVTGGIGWVLSSAAQFMAIYRNKEISPETKSFLLPQEAMDGLINLISFLGITLLVKNGTKKLITTGKFAPKSVREYLNKSEIYKNKVGKLDFNIDDVLKNSKPKDFPVDSYNSYKNITTTIATVGASILACNVATPIIRNNTASKVQKAYIDIKNNPVYINNNDNLKI